MTTTQRPLPDDLVEACAGTVWQALERAARTRAGATAYVQIDDDRRRRELTFGEVRERALRLSEGLHGIGVRRGDRVGIWMTNRMEWIVTHLAVMRLGGVLVPLNTRLTPPEVGYQLRHAEVRHLVVLDRFRRIDFVEALAELAPELRTAQPGALYSPALPDLRSVVVSARAGGATPANLYRWEDLAAGDPAAAAAADATAASVTGSDLAMIKYTSGSTGHPKGVLLEQGGIVVYGKAHTTRLGLGPEDRFFSAMPFFHAGGSLWGLQTMLETAGTLVFTEAFDPPLAGELVESERCTVLFGILATELVTSALRAGRDFSSVRMSRPGGHDADALLTGVRLVINPYGLTECYGAVTMCGPDDPPDKQRTTNGRVLPGQELKVVDPATGAEAGPGVTGEAWVRGNIMRGYWKRPEATAATVDVDGWVHSEDLVTVDEQGYVTYAGRLKLMLKVGGENVSVEEVERTVLEHGSVFHCVVVGVPDPRLTEVARAYVVPRPDATVDPEELLDWLRARLARFKVPREVVVVEALPMLGNAKFDRPRIQEMALRDQPVGG